MPIKVSNFFFDKPHVIALIGKANADKLGLTGSHIKRTAQESMRYTVKKSSSAGQPPRAHQKTGALIRKRLFNWYDTSTKSMVIGSEKLSSTRTSRFGVTLPEVLEKGGQTTNLSPKKYHVRSGGFVDYKNPLPRVRYPATVAARPYMGPALAKEIPLIPDRWKNSIKGP